MILALSCSSPRVSVAVLSDAGDVLSEHVSEPGQSASAALASLTVEAMRAADCAWPDIRRIAVDAGPGGFTSSRVGVTFAKTLAWSLRIPVVTATAFDLIARDGPVAVPSRKGVYLVRQPGESSFTETVEPGNAVGYGLPDLADQWPTAARFDGLIAELVDEDPLSLVPAYASEPSISRPKSGRVLPGGP